MAHLEGRYTSICASRWDRADEVEPSRVEASRLVGTDRGRADKVIHRRADGGGRHLSQSVVNIFTAGGGGLELSQSRVNILGTR